MKFAQLFSGLLEEIYNYSEQEAKEYFASLFDCTDKEALEVFRLYREMIESGIDKSAQAKYQAAVNKLRTKYEYSKENY